MIVMIICKSQFFNNFDTTNLFSKRKRNDTLFLTAEYSPYYDSSATLSDYSRLGKCGLRLPVTNVNKSCVPHVEKHNFFQISGIDRGLDEDHQLGPRSKNTTYEKYFADSKIKLV